VAGHGSFGFSLVVVVQLLTDVRAHPPELTRSTGLQQLKPVGRGVCPNVIPRNLIACKDHQIRILIVQDLTDGIQNRGGK
jgi:hypothetical protein